MKPKIDPDLSALIPPLSQDEYNQLEENILKEGIRDKLIVWEGILLDGHNRLKIALKHGLDYQTGNIILPDRNAAKAWMIDNQLGRRNLTPAQRDYLLGLRYKQEKQSHGGDRASEQNVHLKTAEKLGAMHGVSHMTVQRAEKFADGIDNIAKARPELKQEILQGRANFTKAEVQEFASAVIEEEVERRLKEREEARREERERKAEAIKQAQSYIAEQQTNTGQPPVIYLADCTEFELGEKYDLLITDPPYSTDVDNLDYFILSWYCRALEEVKDTGFAYIFIGAYPEEVRAYLNAEIPPHLTLDQILVWTYKNTLGAVPKNRYAQNYQNCLFFRGVNAPPLDAPLTAEQWAVQEINAPDGRLGDRYHAWQKPLEIGERFIRHTTKKGDLVFDPFACTGTFLVAAANLGRRGVGCEIDKDHAEIAIGRGCVYG